MTTEIQTAPAGRAPVTVGRMGLEFHSLDEVGRFALALSKSGLAPKGIESPEAITVAIQMGMEVGLAPMAAMQNIAVINGRPTIWGDAQLAIVRSSGLLVEFTEWYEAAGERLTRNPSQFNDDSVCAVCRVRRDGGEPQEYAFSVADAKRAGLWGKGGPWTQYPARMLKARARAFVLRDNFGDVLKGLHSTEEAQDSPEERVVSGRAVEVASEPAAALTNMLGAPAASPPARVEEEAPEPKPTSAPPSEEPGFALDADPAPETTPPQAVHLRIVSLVNAEARGCMTLADAQDLCHDAMKALDLTRARSYNAIKSGDFADALERWADVEAEMNAIAGGGK